MITTTRPRLARRCALAAVAALTTVCLAPSPARAAFPSIAASATSNSTTTATSHVISLPTGISAGHLLVVFYAYQDPSGSTAKDETWPGGWTELVASACPTWCRGTIRYRIADGSEGSTITVTSTASVRSAHIVHRITSASTGSPIAGSSTATGSPANQPALTPAGGAKDYLWITAAFTDGHTDFVEGTPPTGWTFGAESGVGGSFGAATATAHLAENASTKDPDNFLYGNDGQPRLAATLAIEPGAAAPRRIRFQVIGPE